jgi:phospholipid/cholesterol/gamma-HCH transport system substrate-binding protein
MIRLLAAVAVLASLVVGSVYAFSAGQIRRHSVVVPAATNLVEGTPIRVNGFPAGIVEDIAAVGNQARIAFTVDPDFAPLHEGATVRIGWKALLGERFVEVIDGPADAPELPDRAMLEGKMPAPVEIDDVLSMLDQPTRQQLASLVRGLDSTVTASAPDIQETLRTAGPAVGALGDVLRGVGTDGPAIRQLVVRVDDLVTALAGRDAELRAVIAQLADSSSAMATRGDQLREVLNRASGTVALATDVLDEVPPTVDEAAPLLDELAEATDKLRPVAADLRPLLADLRPAVNDLRPTLDGLSRLLGDAPAMLDSLRTTIPKTNQALVGLTPTLDFLRPYSPEMVGWMANWASAMANYDVNGHYTRGMVQGGVEAWNANPGFTGPGVEKDPRPLPGAAAGEPWADAFGEEMN